MSDYVIESKRKTSLRAAVLLIGGLALLPVAGCETIERETGMGRSTQIGAASGGAFGGIVAAIAGTNPAWIAASVVLGGITGGVIGNHMGKDDAERHARANYSALDRLGAGQSDSWQNKKTGNYGSTTVTKVSTNGDGTVCKNYREKIHTEAESVTREGKACRAPGGNWRAI